MHFFNKKVTHLFILLLSFVLINSAYGQSAEDISAIQDAINSSGFNWTAGENWVTKLPPEKRKALLGENSPGSSWTAGENWVTELPPEQKKTLLGEMSGNAGVPFDTESSPDAAPVSIDWRNYNGQNYITPIKDQSTCGSCVAFGAVATVESLARVEQADPSLNIDLSEMHLFNCGGGSCSLGWYNSEAAEYFRENGVPTESCWPYSPVNQSCSNTCPNWQDEAISITSWQQISGETALMNAVAIAPVLVSYEVYSDFYSYTGGIYQKTPGATFEGGHAVSVVGYDTSGPINYWIVKNSWGENWGESGYFRIAFGECDIEYRSTIVMSGVIGVDPNSPWDYCFQDTAYTPELQMSLDGDKVRGQAIQTDSIHFPASITGKYYLPSKGVNWVLFSIDYMENSGMRFYQLDLNSMTAETWGVDTITGELYHGPEIHTFTPCNATSKGDADTGDDGSKQ